MANANLRPMQVSFQEGNNATPQKWEPEGANQTFLMGAPLVWSSGTLVESGANPTAVFGVSNGPGHNVAASAAQVLATKVFTETVYEISVDKASLQGGASALLALSNLGATIGLTKDSLGVWYADVDKMAANQCMTIYGFPDGQAGAVNGRVYVKFLAANVAN